MKHALLLLLLFALATGAKAADEWKLYFKNEKVQVFYRYTDCHDNANGIHQQKVLFKYSNLTNNKVAVTYDRTLFYGYANPAAPDLRNQQVVLNARQTVEGSCADKAESMYIFSKHLDFKGPELKKFELKNFSVNVIQ